MVYKFNPFTNSFQLLPSVFSSLAFSESISFASFTTIYEDKLVKSALNFTPDAIGAVAGNQTTLRLLSDSNFIPTFTGFKQSTGSSRYDNRLGILNIVTFFFDGTDYWYSVFQELDATPADVTSPTLENVLLSGSTIVLTYSEELGSIAPPLTAFTFSGNESISGITVSGSTITVELSSAPSVSGSLSYTIPAENAISDVAGNNADSFSGLEINVPPSTGPSEELVFSTRTANISKDGTDYTTTEPGFGSSYLLGDKKIPANTDGWFSIQYITSTPDTNNALMGFNLQEENVPFSGANQGYEYFTWFVGAGGTIYRGTNGGGVTNTTEPLPQNGHLRLIRLSGVISVEKSSDGNTWSSVYTYPGTQNAELFLGVNLGGSKLSNARVSGGVDR